jgi:hypothetical protein
LDYNFCFIKGVTGIYSYESHLKVRLGLKFQAFNKDRNLLEKFHFQPIILQLLNYGDGGDDDNMAPESV